MWMVEIKTIGEEALLESNAGAKSSERANIRRGGGGDAAI